MSTSLFLSDILKRAGLDVNRVKLIRHSINQKEFIDCYNKGYVFWYTSCQKPDFSNGYDYWVVFISDKGTSARLEGCYKVNGNKSGNEAILPSDFPYKNWFETDEKYYYELEKTTHLEDLFDRLIIDWGKSARMWHQKATNEKPVLAIQASIKYSFFGFENIVLKFNELKEIIEDPILYQNWHSALSSVYAIYLIVDTLTGKQYIGSAYGAGGLLKRWECYIKTKHGNNKGVSEVICDFPERYEHFQFSILQILPKNLCDDDVIATETLYKQKLLCKEFGMNRN